MYLFYLTLKTLNALIACGILIYTLIIAVLSPILKRKDKYIVMRILCVLPALLGIVHLIIYGTILISHFLFLYLETLIPLFFLFYGKKPPIRVIRNIAASVLSLFLCFVFLLTSLSAPYVHNYTRDSYTQSFKKMLRTLKKEYCLNSWKNIDYDALLSEYLPRVEEAEKNHDETAYAAIITEVTYRFFDSHVYTMLSPGLEEQTYAYLAGNDYGLSMIRADDGSIIAVFVEPGCVAENLGIHEGTTIVAWDDQPVDDAIDEVECIYPDFCFPVKENEDVFRPVFLAGKGGDSVSITFLDDAGMTKRITVNRIGTYVNRLGETFVRLTHYDMRWRNFYSCMLDDSCGYIQIVSEQYDTFGDIFSALRKGYYPNLTEYYAEMISDLESSGMKYLIIDIRNNMGGYDSVAGALASLFTEEKTHMVSFGYEDANGYHIRESQYIFPDGRYKNLPVVVLTNSRCMSAGDGMAKFLSDCPNVTLMGITSSSCVNQNNGGYIYLTDHITVCYPVFLSLSEEGTPLIDPDEKRETSIPLDVTIPITRENAGILFSFDERDVELEYATEYLKRSEND